MFTFNFNVWFEGAFPDVCLPICGSLSTEWASEEVNWFVCNAAFLCIKLKECTTIHKQSSFGEFEEKKS